MADMGAVIKGSAERDALGDWLRRTVGLYGDLDWGQVPGGLSNLTYIVTDERGRRVVVRRPPDGQLTGGAHDVLREARIMSALLATAVPVPRVLAVCAAPQLVSVPCYVMEHVPGKVLASAASAERLAESDRRRLGFRLIGVLADMQAVDLDQVGLGDLRRRTPYLKRQTRRWTAQWQATADRPVPAVDHVARQLVRILPQVRPEPDCLVHGDFRLGNVMITGDAEPQVSALLDWELATVGHPLADLGFLGARVQAPPGVLEADTDPLSVAGFPAYEELVACFQERTGVDTSALPVFVALAAWRWAIIVEGIQQRFSRGQMGDLSEDSAWHRRRAELLAEFAAATLD